MCWGSLPREKKSSWCGSAALPPANKWPCRAAVIRGAERVRRPRNLSVVTTGNRCPAVRSHPIRCAAEVNAVTGRDVPIAGQSRFANLTTTWLETRSVLRNRKLKIKTSDAWDFWICNHDVNRKVVTPIPRKEIQRLRGYVSRDRDTAAREAATCARDRMSLRRSMVVFSNKGAARLTPICFCALSKIRNPTVRSLPPSSPFLIDPPPSISRPSPGTWFVTQHDMT